MSGDTEWMKSYERAILIGIAVVAVIFIISKLVRHLQAKISAGGKHEKNRKND